MMRGNGLFEESAVPAGVNEPRDELRIVAVAVGLGEEPHERSWRLTDVCLQVRVELMSQRQPRIQRKRPTEGILSLCFAFGDAVDVFADHEVAPPQTCP